MLRKKFSYLQKKIKGVIQAKGNEEKKQIERLKKFFYSMEFSDIQALLFTKKWTTVEEEIAPCKKIYNAQCHFELNGLFQSYFLFHYYLLYQQIVFPNRF